MQMSVSRDDADVFTAARLGDVAAAERYIAQGGPVNTQLGNSSLLATAAHYGHGDVVSLLLQHAANRAREYGLDGVSLLVFEGNSGALALYRRHGFEEVDRRPIVPHPLIQHTGDCLLMVQPA